eukprot:13082116-Alexandrium_andersonii.AAC.1
MSASLVGSEMCIRDSSKLPAAACCILYVCCRTSGAALLTDHIDCEVHGPVSYTHLTLPTICSV